MKLNVVRNEDCLETMAVMPADFIDLVVTSPPYDNLRDYDGYSFDFEATATALFRVMKEGGVVVWVVGDQTKDGDESGTSFRQALFFKEVGFKLFDTMIYLKPPRPIGGTNRYYQQFEYMFIFSKLIPKTTNLIADRQNNPEYLNDRRTNMRGKNGHIKKNKLKGNNSEFGRRTNVWKYNVAGGHSASDDVAYEHPAIFPERLVRDHILSWSDVGDLVYDPFMGSGTTAVVARDLGRNYIGSEISGKYCEIIEKRLNPAQLPLFGAEKGVEDE